jgi:phage-related protein
MASSKKDLLDMPRSIIRGVGVALSVAQRGGKDPSAKPWKGEGPGVMEIVSDFDSDTFRAVYTITFRPFTSFIVSRRNHPEERKPLERMSISYGRD